jgi:hypothetical protein
MIQHLLAIGEALFNAGPQHQPREPCSTSCQCIDQIPPELVLEIASRLPSSAALALCDRRLFAILSGSSLPSLKKEHVERERFLLALSRDLMDTFYCFRCMRLHFYMQDYRQTSRLQGTIRKVTSLAYKKVSSRAQRCGAKDLVTLRFVRTSFSRCNALSDTTENRIDCVRRSHLTREHAQVAMQLYRRGHLKDAVHFLDCASITEPHLQTISLFPTYWGFNLFEASLVRDRICTRTQTWMFVPGPKKWAVPTILLTTMCKHIDSNTCGDALRFMLQCKLRHSWTSEASCGGCPELLSCSTCLQDVFVDVKIPEVGSESRIVVFTQWRYMASDLMEHLITERPRDAYEQGATTPFSSTLDVKHEIFSIKTCNVVLL